MGNFTGFFRGITWFIFIAALLWSYMEITSTATITVDLDHIAVSADTFFFIAVAIFLVVNLVFLGFTNVLKKIKTTEDGKGMRNRSFKLDIMGWTTGLSGIVNVFLASAVIYLGYLNMSEDFMVAGLSYFIYLGPIMLVAWFIYLGKLLSQKRVIED